VSHQLLLYSHGCSRFVQPRAVGVTKRPFLFAGSSLCRLSAQPKPCAGVCGGPLVAAWGDYKIENLWAGNPLEGMRFKADLAMQTRHLPEGAKVKLNVAPEPK